MLCSFFAEYDDRLNRFHGLTQERSPRGAIGIFQTPVWWFDHCQRKLVLSPGKGITSTIIYLNTFTITTRGIPRKIAIILRQYYGNDKTSHFWSNLFFKVNLFFLVFLVGDALFRAQNAW